MNHKPPARHWPRLLIAAAIAFLGLAVAAPAVASPAHQSLALGTEHSTAPVALGSATGDAEGAENGKFAGSEFGFRGFVRDGKKPVEGAHVEIRDGDTVLGEDETDADGAWGIIRVPEAGVYTLVVDVEKLDVSFANGDVFSADIELPAALKVLNRIVLLEETARNVTSTGDQFLQRAIAGLNLGLLLALAAVGLSLLFGTTRITNFAHAENVTFGGMIGYLLVGHLGVPLLIGILAATAAGALFGFAQDVGLWRPMRRKGIGLVPIMIVTIGFGLALRSLFQVFFGNGSRPITNETWGEPLQLGPATLPVTNVATMVISILVLGGVAAWLAYGRIGKATRAIANNTRLAEASGIDVDKVVRVVWIVSGALAALSGILLGVFNQIDVNTGFNALLLMFSAIILGGLGSTIGALVGAVVIGLFTEILVLWIPADMKYVGALFVLILILLVRPQGIFGHKERIG